MADHRSHKHGPADKATRAQHQQRVIAARDRVRSQGGRPDTAGGPPAADRARELRRRGEHLPT